MTSAENASGFASGDKYLFVSYAHKNTEQVVRVVDELRRHHIRVWYDEGIHGGRDWSKCLTGCIDECEAGLVFVSKKSAHSRNCRNEIDRLNERNKEIFPIVLEKFDIPQNILQRINRNQFNQLWSTTPEALVQTLYALPEVRACYSYTIDSRVYSPGPVGAWTDNRDVRAAAARNRKSASRFRIAALIAAGVLIISGAALAIVLAAIL